MNVAIIGAGAVGGFMAARLARAGVSVSIVDLDEHLEAIRTRGLEIIEADGERWSIEGFHCAESAAKLDPHDVVVLGVKSFQLPAAVAGLDAVLHDDSVVVTPQNGVPWWFFHGWGGEHADQRLESLDPDGTIAAAVPSERILGCIAYMAAEIEAPGVIRHVEGDRFPLGWLDDSERQPLPEVAALFESAGLRARVLTDVRSEIWLKLVGTAAFNPISALTGGTMAGICRNPASRQTAWDAMVEAEKVGNAMDISLRVPLERRLTGAEKVGDHKTSMLQDVEQGRRTESDAILAALIEIGDLVGVETPCLQTLHGLLELATAD